MPQVNGNAIFQHNYQENHPQQITAAATRPVISARNISNASFQHNPTKVLIVGYSPTGGGHTNRILQVVAKAMEKGALTAGSEVIFYIPPPWENTPRPAILTELACRLSRNGVTVKLAEAEKPVVGYLDPVTGGSDDARILERLALCPLRAKSYREKDLFIKQYFNDKQPVTHVSEIETYHQNSDINNLPLIPAIDLVRSLSEKHGVNNIRILTDMAPELQKAGRNLDVPVEQCLDQQNHAILLDLEHIDQNIELDKAILAKMLAGRGERLSYICLGGKNSLKELGDTMAKLDIQPGSQIAEVRTLIYRLLLEHVVEPSAFRQRMQRKNYAGVVAGKAVKSVSDIHKVVYIYAHKKSEIIGQHIIRRIENADRRYNNTLFLFCGKDALPDHNAMHLAYLADADGITTAGAGTCGEFFYLHDKAGARSNLLILPIEGHNEQQAVAAALCQSPVTQPYVLRLSPDESLAGGDKIDRLVNRKPSSLVDRNFQQVIRAVGDDETYVQQAYSILFQKKPLSPQARRYQIVEQNMYASQGLKATRHYLKLVFQLINYASQGEQGYPIAIRFKKNATPAVTFNDFASVNAFFNDSQRIRQILRLPDDININALPLLAEVKQLFDAEEQILDNLQVNQLKHQMGKIITTGF